MTIPQAVVFWLMVLAMVATFRDIETARGTLPAAPDGLQPVDRRQMFPLRGGRSN